jgi:hypothetical protein
MFSKVSWYNCYISFILALNLIKKKSRNQIQLLDNFYSLYQNKNSNIIDLKENDIKINSPNTKDLNNNEKLKKIIEESNYIDSLIKIVNDKLSDNVKGYKNEFSNVSLIENDLIPLFPERGNCINFLAIKSESGINVENLLVNDLKNKDQKKIDINRLKNDSQPKNLCPLSFSNKLYIISNNNTPLTLIDIDLKKEKKDKVENFSNDNKYIINKNLINQVNDNDAINEEKKDFNDSDFSLFDDASNFERFIDNFNSDL